MICAAIAFCVPIASMVMIVPLMSTSRKSSGIAVISFDFSAQATCPSDRPNSLAHTLTECKAPRPLLRSWLRRAVLPSTAKTGWSTPVASAALRTQRLQPAHEAGLKRVRLAASDSTRRKTSLRGMPLGNSNTCSEELCFERGPLGDRRRPAGAGQHRHHRDDDDTDQRMLAD